MLPVLFLINFILGVLGNIPCAPRSYKKESIVCVCNLTYCDEIGLIKNTPGIVTRFETGSSGKRFEKAIFKLTQDNTLLLLNDTKTITINHNVTYQKIIGFGGSITDATGVNIFKLPTSLRQQIMKDYFSGTGLEYNLVRIPIGGSDFSTRKYTYDDGPEDLNLTNFKLQFEDFNYKIPLMKVARNLTNNKIKFFASPWSAPVWMKTNNDISGMGTLIGNSGGQYFKTWADYFVKFLDAYKRNGLDMWGLTTQNEPFDGFIQQFPFNCMGWTPKMMRDFIKLNLGPTLHKAGYNEIKLMTLDDQRIFLTNWTNIILKDKEAAKYVSGIALHWYLDQVVPLDLLDKAHHDFPNYFLLSTEACEGSFDEEKVSLGNWKRAENYAYDIITDLQHYVSGWVDWNLVLDEQGGPNWARNFVDAPIIVNATAEEYYKQPMFYILGHFSKFLPGDSVKIQTNETGSEQVNSIAFKTPRNETVLIILNKDTRDIPLNINDLQSNKILNTKISAKSIQTYIW